MKKRFSVLALVLSLVLLMAFPVSGNAVAAGSTTNSFDALIDSPPESQEPSIADVISELDAEFSPLDISDSNIAQRQTTGANLPVVDADSINDKSYFDLSFSAQSGNASAARSTPASVTRAGQINIAHNTIYTHSLSSASDYWVYLCQVPSGGHATAFLDSTSAMDFYMEVQVLDSAFNVKSAGISEMSRSVYNGQRVRLPVEADDYVAIYIDMSTSSSFVQNSYDFGIILNAADSTEPNEQPEIALNLGTAGSATTWSSSIDNSFDVDWFRFSHTDVARLPRVAFVASNADVHASVYKMVNGTLTKVTDIANTGSWATINENANTTYYMVVYSTNLGAGSYQIGTGASLIYLLDGRVVVDFSDAEGDTNNPTSFGSGGSLPTVRYNTTGTITLRDSRGNPIPSLPYQIRFYTIYNGASGTPGLIGYTNYTTDTSGTGSAYTEIEVWPTASSPFFVYAGYRYCPARISVVLPDGVTAELMVSGPAGGIAPSGYAYRDAWHYGGYIAI